MNRLRNYLVTLPIILVAVLTAQLMQPHFDRANVMMVYMLAVVLVAFRLGGGPAIMACLLSVFLYDLINVPPYFRLGAETYEYLFSLLVMLITAGIISTLAGRLRQKAVESREREARTAALYALSAELATRQSEREIIESVQRHVARAFRATVETFLPEEAGPAVAPGPAAGEALRPAFMRQEGGGIRATAPVVVEGRTRYLLWVGASARRLGTREQQEQLAAMMSQCAQAIERTALRARVHEKELQIQKESLRNSILSTISHDLRTPLASIIGASSSLLAEGDRFSPEARTRLRTVIYEESTHMLHLVENLLDMARLQGGDVPLSREWEALEEIVGSAVAAVRRRVRSHQLVVEVPHDLPFIRCDGVLIERVLINLLENAVKYSPAGSVVRLSAAVRDQAVEVEVSDQGDGIPEAERERVFDPFFRLHPSAAGGGLGLTICRRIVEAHGGRIGVEAAEGGGARVRFSLPLPADAVELPGEGGELPAPVAAGGEAP